MADDKVLDQLTSFDPQQILESRGLQAYWIGIVRGCPISRYRLGPITIMTESFSIIRDAAGEPVEDGSGLSKVRYNDGKDETLTEDHVRHICSRAMKVAIRKNALEDMVKNDGTVVGNRFRAHGIKTYQPETGYQPREDDERLSDYLYVVDAEDAREASGRADEFTLTRGGKINHLPRILREEKTKKKPTTRKRATTTLEALQEAEPKE